MQTPSEEMLGAKWELRNEAPHRSVFGNYGSREASRVTLQDDRAEKGGTSPSAQTLQTSIDCAMARAFTFGFLAGAFADPDLESWEWFCDESSKSTLLSAVSALAPTTSFAQIAADLAKTLTPEAFE